MTTTHTIAAVVLAAILVLSGCGAKRLTDDQYQTLCVAYRTGLGLGSGWAAGATRDFAMRNYGLSRSDAVAAVDTARREYCP